MPRQVLPKIASSAGAVHPLKMKLSHLFELALVAGHLTACPLKMKLSHLFELALVAGHLTAWRPLTTPPHPTTSPPRIFDFFCIPAPFGWYPTRPLRAHPA
ncbi:hypothetical protein QE152_g37044 [Popillia japonica]|uniref:Uncharacterized protein n=1 Tax=Popillia japonica TaxID=7064 RepID=A0AAW1IB09_POPJA